jgi:3-deoxy-manno-octulosonate cytidylyltransferase (CMP-KDO synthetase)
MAKSKRQTIIGIIPARFASTRLMGKPLININGKPMIKRVYEQAKKSNLLNRVIVATDNVKIFNTVNKFGGEAVMTSRKHKSGTDRIGEILKLRKSEMIECEIVVNIQGDEPFIAPENIDKAIEPLIRDKNINVSTLAIQIKNTKDIKDPNIVKVIFNKSGDAIYFSRSPVPYNRDKIKNLSYYKHIGLYVYRRNFLEKFIKVKPSKLETAEKLEQLRIIENGEKIRVVLTDIDSHSIDTKNDLIKIKSKLIQNKF